MALGKKGQRTRPARYGQDDALDQEQGHGDPGPGRDATRDAAEQGVETVHRLRIQKMRVWTSLIRKIVTLTSSASSDLQPRILEYHRAPSLDGER